MRDSSMPDFIEDRQYCMSSFLMYRVISDGTKCFSKKYPPYYYPMPKNRQKIHNSKELLNSLKTQMEDYTRGKKRCAIALSGGIDSAILLRLMPKGSIAYTFKCIVPGVIVKDESRQAAEYIKYAMPEGIEHRIVPVYWEDMEALANPLMERKGAPIHSIEVQISKAASVAKSDGCDAFIFGETADCVYGGHSNLLAKDWTIGEFIDRWSFVLPYKALRNFEMDIRPFERYEKNGYIDVLPFLTYYESAASYSSYINACALAGIDFFAPYAHTVLDGPLDFERIRRGENKYLVREVFEELYPGFSIPDKTPMPRPMNEWLKEWNGPVREEFWPNCTDEMTGDQKWLVWSLERFLNIIDKKGEPV